VNHTFENLHKITSEMHQALPLIKYKHYDFKIILYQSYLNLATFTRRRCYFHPFTVRLSEMQRCVI